MKTQDIIKSVKELVKERSFSSQNIFGPETWETHFIPVVKNALLVAERVGANKEIVEIAAWLHDIASISNKDHVKDHHIYGQEYAQQILSEFNYPQNKIDQVKHCILAHRGSQKIVRESLEAQCVADGDAMAHFDSLNGLFYVAIEVKKLNPIEARDFVRNKLKRSWLKLSVDAQEIIKHKHEVVQLLLN